jgi:transmembrane sensor
MNKYHLYQLEDFVQDTYFRKWVVGDLPEEDHFWPAWLASHPEQHETIEQAKALIIAFQCEPIPTDQGEIRVAIDRILHDTESHPAVPFHQRTWWRIAASVLLIAGLGYWITSSQIANSDSLIAKVAYSSIPGTEMVNTEAAPKEYHLSDGSTVTLHKDSQLRLSPDFGELKREVYLTGEAFFNVTKNPEKPFLVYTGSVVTKVLGTSFKVSSYEADANVSVAVSTGKVTVFKKNKSSAKGSLSDEIILTPNQQAVYIKSKELLVKTLVEKPVILNSTQASQSFTFNETPLTEVLSSFEEAYGVNIVFDEEVFKHCNLTATLTNEPLFQKLDLICETIQAHYEVADGQVIMYGKKCQ